MALMPYSVSPFLRDHSVGPNPTMYWVTFTPNFLAGTMCPISCSAIEASRPTAKISTPSAYSMRPPSPSTREFGGARTRPSVCLFDVFDGTRVPDVGLVLAQPLTHHIGNGVHDLQETDRTGMKGSDERLVGGVVHRRSTAARGTDLAGERDGREGRVVERVERPVLGGGPVDRRRRIGDAIGPAECERDGQSHVRRRDLREGRTVPELDHRVDDRLRVHHDLDGVVRDVEEQVRLDHLEALV